MIDWFLSNISAKYYKNLSMLSRVIAENVGDVFLRHSVCCMLFRIVKARVRHGMSCFEIEWYKIGK